MRDGYFVNVAIETAIKEYLSNSNNKESINYNSFLVVVIRILVLIYGELDVINPYYTKNGVAFLENLSKFGMSKSDVALFKDELLNYLEYDLKVNNKNRKIKVANPYFKKVLNYLIDMFVIKKQNKKVSYEDEEEFLELCYTTHTKNSYRFSFTYLNNSKPIDNEKYYYSRLNNFDTTKDLTAEFDYNNKKISPDMLINKKEAYTYDGVEEKKSFANIINFRKFSTGNGYVDILLLMSIIVTSFSVIAIMFFSFM